MKILNIFIFWLYGLTVFAQSSDRNYIHQIIPKIPVTNPLSIPYGNPALASESITYFNGFGDVIQINQKGATIDGKDLVQSNTYNIFGLNEKEYLSFKANQGNGNFVNNPETSCLSFYASQQNGIDLELKPFSVNSFSSNIEKKLISRIRSGNNWHIGDKKSTYEYTVNTSNDNILLWQINNTNQKPELVNSGSSSLSFIPVTYSQGDLEKQTVTDEEGFLVESFFDFQGKLICEIKHNGQVKLETYYIYNRFGQLGAMFQPEGINKLRSNGFNLLVPLDLIQEYCFIYEYDERGRLISEKKPGSTATKNVYNNKDQLSFYYQGNQENATPNRIWFQSRFDRQGRIIMKGINLLNYNIDQNYLQLFINTHPSSPENRILNFPYYTTDEYSSLANNFDPLQIFIFDDYSIQINGTSKYEQNPQVIWPFLSNVNWDTKPIGKLTVQFDKVLDNSNVFLETVYYYDLRGRVIIESKKNIDGGWLVTQFNYAHDGKILNEDIYITDGVLNQVKVSFKKEIEYYPNNLIKNIWVTDFENKKIKIVEHIYNGLNYLTRKRIHNKQGIPGFLQNIDYLYSATGELKKINNPNLLSDDIFALEINRETSKTNSGMTSIPRFDGQVSSVKWITTRDTVFRGFNYFYDGLKRISTAKYFGYSQPVSSLQIPIFENDWFENIDFDYDYNGNIKQQQLKGLITSRPNLITPSQFHQIGVCDNLNYSYVGNKLISVVDNAQITSDELNDFHDKNLSGVNDYSYDSEGKLIQDLNKNINEISYNELNFIKGFNWLNGEKYSITYKANGEKIKSEYYNSLNALEMENHYLGPIVLSRDMITSNLEFDTYFHEEGRIVNSKKENVINNGASFNNQLQHQYDYKDHLGYTRLTYVPKLINYDWFASFESLDQTNDQVYPGDITNLTYNPNKPRFERWMENRSSEDSYEGLFSAKVTDFNGPKIDLFTQPGDTLEISAYAKTNGFVEPPSITPSWILGLIGVIPNQYTINESGNYSYTGPQLTINFIPIIFNIINFFNNNPDNSTPSGALIARSFDSSNNVINAYSIPVSNQNWTELKVTYPILDEREVKVEVFLASRPGNTTYYDNVSIQMKRNIPKIIQENHYTPFGLNIRGLEFVDGLDTNHFQLFGGKELVLRNKLELNDFGARWLDPQLGRFLSVDPLAEGRPEMTPYHFVSNNPINRIDPDGRWDDWVQNAEGEIYWDKNATSQTTTKAGETYLGRDLTFTFNSYIDGDLWDGPMGSFPAGDKLTSTINVTSNTDADNNLLSVDIKSSTFVHKTGGIFQGDGYYPGQKNVNLDIKGATSGYASFEKHAKVNGFEEMGLGMIGYDKVNVAQKLTLGLKGNNLSVTGSTDIFPSATLSVNGTQLFKYNQPSFKGTHGYKRETVFGDNGMGGSTTTQFTPLRPAPAFYQRYKK